jgi:hypothetical protein
VALLTHRFFPSFCPFTAGLDDVGGFSILGVAWPEGGRASGLAGWLGQLAVGFGRAGGRVYRLEAWGHRSDCFCLNLWDLLFFLFLRPYHHRSWATLHCRGFWSRIYCSFPPVACWPVTSAL